MSQLGRRMARLEARLLVPDELALIRARLIARGKLWSCQVLGVSLAPEYAALLEGDTPGQAAADQGAYARGI